RRCRRGLRLLAAHGKLPFPGAFFMRLPKRQAVIDSDEGARMSLRMRVHERESIGLALRRFKKLLERSGMQKELRKRKYYVKPCEARRRDELRKLSNIRKGKLPKPAKPRW